MADASTKAAATTMGPCKSKPGTSTDVKTPENDVTTPKNDVTDNNATADGAVNSEKRMVENLTEKLLDSWIADAATKALEKSEPATSESFSVSHFESDDDVIKDYDVVINDECYDEEEQRKKELLEEEIDDMDYDLDDDITKSQNDVTPSNEAGTHEISNPAPAASVQNESAPDVVKTDDVKTDVGASGDVDAAVDLGDVTAAAMPDVADVIKALQGGMGAPQEAGAAGTPEPDPEETLETEEWYYSDDSDFDPPTSMSTGQIAAENMRAQMSGTVGETDDQNTSTETTSDSGAQESPQDDMVQKKNLENLRTGTEDEVKASIAKETKAETKVQEIENESKTAPTSTPDKSESGMASTSADESWPSAADKPAPVVGELSSTVEASEKSTEIPAETSPNDEKSGSQESKTNKCEENEKPNENSKPQAPRATLAEIEARLNSAQQIMKKSEEKPRETSSKEHRETAKSPENKPTASTTANDNNKNDETTKPTEDLNSDRSRTSMADIEARLNSVTKVSTDLSSTSINEILYGSKPNNYVSHYNGLLKLQMDIGRIQRCMSEMQGQIRALSRTVDTMIENVEGDIGISE